MRSVRDFAREVRHAVGQLERATLRLCHRRFGLRGAISAARLATSSLAPKPTICRLERGCEREVGGFPDRLDHVIAEYRSPLNPLGLYDLYNFRDIAVIKGS